MTQRVFVGSLRTGLASATRAVTDGRPSFKPTVELVRRAGDEESTHPFEGPDLAVIGPGDVIGIDRGQIVREEPPPGQPDAEDTFLASLDVLDATLPWLLTLPTMKGRPWIALVVLRDDEGEIDTTGRVPSVTVPAAALPDPADLATWAHVEARLEPGEDLTAVLQAEARTGTDRVVARLICPRKLDKGRGWTACVVPTTKAGVQAALGGPAPADPAEAAWQPGGGPALLPVYHSWRFHTAQDGGSFEEYAERVHPLEHGELTGFGERQINVRYPWPHADLLGAGVPDDVTMTYQGALTPAGSPPPPSETWTFDAARVTFQDGLTRVLAAEQADGQVSQEGIAPPLYGSHHTGLKAVPPTDGWMHRLNLEVRYRLAASLGARYVQVEQEFLMERAWEQVGAIREANRLRAQAELATQAAAIAQAKHLAGLDPLALAEVVDPMDTPIPVGGTTLTALLAGSAAPGGTGGTAFRRLVRPKGAVDRRTRRAAGADRGRLEADPVLGSGLAGVEVVPTQPMAYVVAGAITQSPMVVVDRAARYGTRTMVDLLGAQDKQFAMHGEDVPGEGDQGLMAGLAGGMSSAMGDNVASVAAAGEVRSLRRDLTGFAAMVLSSDIDFAVEGPDFVSAQILASLVPARKQKDRIDLAIEINGLPSFDTAVRPLRPIMMHPVFGFPVGAELLSRWPDWTVPGITEFPENRCTLLQTNSPFVESLLVGLNQEFNRELLWREYPTDQAGTPFARFWPGGADVYDEIAHWRDADALGDHDPVTAGEVPGEENLVLLLRADLLKRYPGAQLLAVQAGAPGIVPKSGGTWKEPQFVIPLDDRTSLFGFDLSLPRARAERWLFVIREPMRGTRFGFDGGGAPGSVGTWAELGWGGVPLDGLMVDPGAGSPPTTSAAGAAAWGRNPVAMARISFQQPFQMAYSPQKLVVAP